MLRNGNPLEAETGRSIGLIGTCFAANVAMSGRDRPAAGSRSFDDEAAPASRGSSADSAALDRGAEPAERGAQLIVGDVGHAVGDAAGLAGVDRRRAGAACSRRVSGAWRSAMRSIARQPRKRLTRSTITSARCWISSAAGPSQRSTSVAGSGSSAIALARPVILIGSAWAAISAPTMSAQWVTISVDAKPWRLNAPTRQGPSRVGEAGGRICRACSRREALSQRDA